MVHGGDECYRSIRSAHDSSCRCEIQVRLGPDNDTVQTNVHNLRALTNDRVSNFFPHDLRTSYLAFKDMADLKPADAITVVDIEQHVCLTRALLADRLALFQTTTWPSLVAHSNAQFSRLAVSLSPAGTLVLSSHRTATAIAPGAAENENQLALALHSLQKMLHLARRMDADLATLLAALRVLRAFYLLAPATAPTAAHGAAVAKLWVRAQILACRVEMAAVPFLLACSALVRARRGATVLAHACAAGGFDAAFCALLVRVRALGRAGPGEDAASVECRVGGGEAESLARLLRVMGGPDAGPRVEGEAINWEDLWTGRRTVGVTATHVDGLQKPYWYEGGLTISGDAD
ncbi:hypothetical protein P8C59_003515 [Phyllachora maydis]|uniref:Uncharacterized protein n=1 Tax=Phyllachora maydis TaxID=1825666 RepID=A0AAD9I0F5_9PEZI|nr:hypothetical protein P8C59_003515 [Phyllachora maydis]